MLAPSPTCGFSGPDLDRSASLTARQQPPFLTVLLVPLKVIIVVMDGAETMQVDSEPGSVLIGTNNTHTNNTNVNDDARLPDVGAASTVPGQGVQQGSSLVAGSGSLENMEQMQPMPMGGPGMIEKTPQSDGQSTALSSVDTSAPAGEASTQSGSSDHGTPVSLTF